MPGAQFAVPRPGACWRSLEAGAEEALEVFGFPFRQVFFVNLGLVFDEEVKFCLGHRIAFEIHLESMSRFQRPFGLWLDWTLDMGIFRFVDSFHHVKIALSILLFPVLG